MKKISLSAICISACLMVHAQSVSLDNYYYQGKDVQPKLQQFSAKESQVLFIDDRRDTTVVRVKDLDKTGKGTMLATMCRFPGLKHIRMEYLTADKRTMKMVDSFLYITSSGQAQLNYPAKKNSFLKTDLSPAETTEADALRDSLVIWHESWHVAFNLLKYDPQKLRSTTDTVRYSIDSFYTFLEGVASKMAEELDSGNVVAYNYEIDFPRGITLVNWMGDTTLGADKQGLVAHHQRTGKILELIEHKWKDEWLMTDAAMAPGKWAPWLNKVLAGDVYKDRLLIFLREDNYATETLLHKYDTRSSTAASKIWINFSDAVEDRLVILVRLVGTKLKKTS